MWRCCGSGLKQEIRCGNDNIFSVQSDTSAVSELRPVPRSRPVWGNGIINSEQWVRIVYLTL
jgi:hypothetical protein